MACACVLNRFCYVQLFATLWILAFQAPLSQGFSRQNYWSRLPCPPPGVLPHPGIELISLTSPALAGRFFPTSATWEAQAESLPGEPQGKPKNTGEGSLSLLQGIFQTQKSNLGFLHCRRILYQLSYQGSPFNQDPRSLPRSSRLAPALFL